MRQSSGGTVASGTYDDFPLPHTDPTVDLPISEVQRILGMDFDLETAASILSSLEFDVSTNGDTLTVTAPPRSPHGYR